MADDGSVPMRSVLATATAVIASLCAPSSVAAFEVCEVSTASQAGGGTIHCEVSIDCTSSADCELEPFPDATCVPFDPTTPSRDYCQPRCGSVFRCNPEDVCPVITGTPGTCSPGWDGNSYCRYPMAATSTYCVEDGEVIPEAQFYRCHHVPGTETGATTHYQFGDCDGDGCANVNDTSPCDPMAGAEGCMAVPPPAECLPSSGGASDGGAGTADAGARGDGGLKRDGSAGGGGGSGAPEPIYDYRGSGGCAVTAVPDGPGWPAAPSVLALAVAARRRRRPITPAVRACAPRAPRGSWANRP